MKYKFVLGLLAILGFISCKNEKTGIIYETETLKINQLSPHAFVHTSYIQTESYGKVASNGLVYEVGNEALVFDTPIGDTESSELINWVQNELNAQVIGVIPTHSHEDCLGGLNAFHDAGIPSYANLKTIEIAAENNRPVPQNGFQGQQEFTVGGEMVLCTFVGEGHTIDNVVGYIPSENILFGGCLLKSDGAGKGYIEEANVTQWPKTIMAIKRKYPDLRWVIPGHGAPGGAELLDYTITLFSAP